MKKILAFIPLLIWTALPTASSRPAAAATPRIRLATLAPRGSTFHMTLQAMAERWRQAPEGGAQLTIYPDGTMGGEADMVRKMRVGQLQAAMITMVGLSEIDRSVTALQYMPLVFRTLDEVDYVREKMRPELEARLQAKGFEVLFWGDAGFIRYFSRDPMTRPEQLKGMKLFAWAGDNYQVDLMKQSGYRPVPLETNDILPGLQTGLIEVVATVPFHALAGQIYNTARNMLDLNWAPLVGATVVLKKHWDEMPQAARDALRQAASEAGEKMRAAGRAENDKAVETMKQRGLKVNTITPEIEAGWHKAIEEFYPRIRGQMVPAEMFDRARQLVHEYRAARGGAKK